MGDGDGGAGHQFADEHGNLRRCGTVARGSSPRGRSRFWLAII